MELANYSDMRNEVIEEEGKSRKMKKDNEKNITRKLQRNTNDKSFDDNFEVKK